MTPSPGDKVICIDASPCKCGCGDPTPVREGALYIVERVTEHPPWPMALLILVGVKSSTRNHTWVALSVERFRRLEEVKGRQRVSASSRGVEGSFGLECA